MKRLEKAPALENSSKLFALDYLCKSWSPPPDDQQGWSQVSKRLRKTYSELLCVDAALLALGCHVSICTTSTQASALIVAASFLHQLVFDTQLSQRPWTNSRFLRKEENNN